MGSRRRWRCALTTLVTGGTGFLGAALVRRLVQSGEKVRVLDNDSRGRRQRIADLDVEIVTGDIRHASVVNSAVHGVEACGASGLRERHAVLLREAG